MNNRPTFEETVHNLELDLDHMHLLYSYLSVPTLLYDDKDNIAWCNKSMLNLFWGVGVDDPTYRNKREYFGKSIHDVMPKELAEYIQEQNNLVRTSGASQYEIWQDETMQGTIEWKVLRFPCGEHHLGVILFPLDEQYLEKCDRALHLKE